MGIASKIQQKNTEDGILQEMRELLQVLAYKIQMYPTKEIQGYIIEIAEVYEANFDWFRKNRQKYSASKIKLWTIGLKEDFEAFENEMHRPLSEYSATEHEGLEYSIWVNNYCEAYNFYTVLLDESESLIKDLENPESEKSELEIIPFPSGLGNWREDKKDIADVFAQLKDGFAKDGSPLLDNSYEELALILKYVFRCYADTKTSTIVQTLKKVSANKRNRKITLVFNF